MSVIAAALRELMSAGLTGDALVAAIERIEAAITPTRTARQERNHRYYVSKHTKPSESDAPPSSSPSSSFPLTLSLLTTPPSPTSSENSSSNSNWPRDFREQFWAKYPRKTGKAGALRKLEIVRRSGGVPFDGLIRAVDRYAAENPDLKFVKHPETWLSKGCWDDEGPNAPRAPPDAAPAYLTPPPGCEPLDVIRARFTAARIANGQAAATEVRNGSGGLENGAGEPAQLPFSRGDALRGQG